MSDDISHALSLEQRFGVLRKFLKPEIRHDQKILPRPFTAEFAGSPSSGKTTAMVELDNFLREQGLRVIRIQEGAEIVRNISRSTPLYNITTGLHALRPLISIANGHTYDVAIFDRGVFDTVHWMTYWLEKGQLTLEEFKNYRDFFLSRFWTNDIDISFFFVCDARVAMERELRIAISQKPRETTNEESIRRMVDRYKKIFGNLSPQYSQLRFLDTTLLDVKDMVWRVTEEVTKAFEKRLET